MANGIRKAGLAWGELAVGTKEAAEAWGRPLPGIEALRLPAWDEDETTLALAAASCLDETLQGPLHLAGPLDKETIRMALGLEDVDMVRHAGPDAARAAFDAAARTGGLVLAAFVPSAPVGTEARADEGAAAVALLVEAGATLPPADSRGARRHGRLGPLEPLVGALPTLQAAGVPVHEARAPLRAVSPLRALQEAGAFAAHEAIPDSPMGAYVPMATWIEDLPARLRLEAQRCSGCGKVLYPPRGACPACLSRTFTTTRLPDRARVYAPTRIGRGGAPSEFALEQAQVGAYWLAVVEWPGAGVRLSARLAGFPEAGPAIGDEVAGVVRRLFEQQGRVRYGLKFVPA